MYLLINVWWVPSGDHMNILPKGYYTKEEEGGMQPRFSFFSVALTFTPLPFVFSQNQHSFCFKFHTYLLQACYTTFFFYGPFGLGGRRGSRIEQSRFSTKLAYFQPTLLYSPPLPLLPPSIQTGHKRNHVIINTKFCTFYFKKYICFQKFLCFVVFLVQIQLIQRNNGYGYLNLRIKSNYMEMT